MKNTIRTLLMVLPFVALAGLRADEENAGMPPSPPPPGERGGHGPMSLLTPEERAQVKAAHDKAIAADPSLKEKMKAAHEAFQQAKEALHEAMIKVDPSVEAILAKLPKPGSGGGEKWGGKANADQAMSGSPGAEQGGKRRHKGPPGLANLSESERSQLMAAREKAKSDPAVTAARETRKSATTPEARRAAEETLHKAMHDAMLKADPSLVPVLEKLRAGGRPDAPPSEG